MADRKVALSILLLVILLWTLGLAQAPKDGNGTENDIRSAGCVRQGVEGGCLVLTGFKDKQEYNLFFPSGKKPDPDTAISFEGTEHGGPTVCMQGKPVDVKQWTYLKMKCPPAQQAAAESNEEKKSMAEKQQSPCSDWKAWHDRQPGHAATLHVTGKCTFNEGGYKVELRPAVPQGINPAIYILNRIVHKPTGPVPQVITQVPVHYVEKTNARYTDVTIQPDGVTVPVQEVQ